MEYNIFEKPQPWLESSAAEAVGDPNAFQLLSLIYSEYTSNRQSIQAMDTGNGCLVRIRTQTATGKGNTESLAFVPKVKIVDDINGGKKLQLHDLNPLLVNKQKEKSWKKV